MEFVANEHLWVEKYRPNKISDCILPDSLAKVFKDTVANGTIPNMTLSGMQGIGKTTVAKALCEELGVDYIVINGSMRGNIDTLRVDIQNFASSVSLENKPKVVILDEADYLNCLEENEKIIIIDKNGKQKSIKLKDLPKDKQFKVLSLNIDTNIIEEDVACVVNSDEQDVYEVELEDGRKLQVTADHPFLIEKNGKIEECTINDGLDDKSVLIVS